MKKFKILRFYETRPEKHKESHHRKYALCEWEARPQPILVLSKSSNVVFGRDSVEEGRCSEVIMTLKSTLT